MTLQYNHGVQLMEYNCKAIKAKPMSCTGNSTQKRHTVDGHTRTLLCRIRNSAVSLHIRNYTITITQIETAWEHSTSCRIVGRLVELCSMSDSVVSFP